MLRIIYNLGICTFHGHVLLVPLRDPLFDALLPRPKDLSHCPSNLINTIKGEPREDIALTQLLASSCFVSSHTLATTRPHALVPSPGSPVRYRRLPIMGLLPNPQYYQTGGPAGAPSSGSTISYGRPELGDIGHNMLGAQADSSSTAEIAANAPRYRRKSSTFIDGIHDVAEDQDMAPAQLYSTMSGRLFHSGRIAIVMVGLPARGKT